MLSVTIKSIMLSAFVLIVIMLNFAMLNLSTPHTINAYVMILFGETKCKCLRLLLEVKASQF